MIRLHVTQDLRGGADLSLDQDQSHYLTNVMRKAAGDSLLVFNGRDGEWRATISAAGKRAVTLALGGQARAQTPPSSLELAVALVKRARLETIVEKAAELGCGRIRLFVSARTNADHTNVSRLSAIAVEASEQTGRLDVPTVEAPLKLERLLEGWPAERRLLFCDEAGEAPAALDALAQGKWTVLIGPEGGFSEAERRVIRDQPQATPVSLGPRILRADTAAIAALSLVQAAVGDWRP